MMPAYPPAAHASMKDTDSARVVAAQPGAGPTMKAAQPEDGQTEGAKRLRGGCIPCPVSRI
ncbi:hypothetical protein PLEOSDRAFT_1070073 [Pleurotus ostreatus PC15]|uniref:Uncharacterized protein n=1 Tax=Pleurotus ostreatus (strain PC15) TaxID=1137138 RepID=A0A067P1T0_PLEO1|nr:hypothetical protein PLEOSDRAFT_1070073 [Pleurotus ostreatus PC15]